MNWKYFLKVLVFADLTEDDKLAKLCQKLKEKHAREPVILFIDENDITSTGDLPKKVCLKDSEDFHVISAISPISENYVRIKETGFDFNEMEICVKDEENCMWVNLYLRYRNSRVIQDLCRNVGLSMREEKSNFIIQNIYNTGCLKLRIMLRRL